MEDLQRRDAAENVWETDSFVLPESDSFDKVGKEVSIVIVQNCQSPVASGDDNDHCSQTHNLCGGEADRILQSARLEPVTSDLHDKEVMPPVRKRSVSPDVHNMSKVPKLYVGHVLSSKEDSVSLLTESLDQNQINNSSLLSVSASAVSVLSVSKGTDITLASKKPVSAAQSKEMTKPSQVPPSFCGARPGGMGFSGPVLHLASSHAGTEGVGMDVEDPCQAEKENSELAKVFERNDSKKDAVSDSVSEGDAMKTVYQCCECNYASENKHYYKQHVDLVHGAARLFKCPYCDYAGKRNHALREHLVVHSSQRPYSCHRCNATFRKKGHLTNHTKLHGNSSTELWPCAGTLVTVTESHGTTSSAGLPVITSSAGLPVTRNKNVSSDKIIELNIVASKGRQLWCALCSKEMTSVTTFQEHLQSVHDTEHLYACESCSFVTARREAMMSHLPTHLQPLPLVASLGPEQSVASPPALTQSSPPFACTQCSFSTPTVSLLVAHATEHLSQEPRPGSGQAAKMVSQHSQPQVICSECGHVESNADLMRAHMWNHIKTVHSDSEDSAFFPNESVETDKLQNSLPDNAAFKCAECSFVSRQASHFVKHLLVHKTQHSHCPTIQVSTTRTDAASSGAPSQMSKGVTVYRVRPVTTQNTCTNSDSSPFVHDASTGRFRCTICGYSCEYQRTIKAHIWKHSGHRQVQYPIFQNGPLSVYEDPAAGSPTVPCVDSLAMALGSSSNASMVSSTQNLSPIQQTTLPAVPNTTKMLVNSGSTNKPLSVRLITISGSKVIQPSGLVPSSSVKLVPVSASLPAPKVVMNKRLLNTMMSTSASVVSASPEVLSPPVVRGAGAKMDFCSESARKKCPQIKTVFTFKGTNPELSNLIKPLSVDSIAASAVPTAEKKKVSKKPWMFQYCATGNGNSVLQTEPTELPATKGHCVDQVVGACTMQSRPESGESSGKPSSSHSQCPISTYAPSSTERGFTLMEDVKDKGSDSSTPLPREPEEFDHSDQASNFSIVSGLNSDNEGSTASCKVLNVLVETVDSLPAHAVLTGLHSQVSCPLVKGSSSASPVHTRPPEDTDIGHEVGREECHVLHESGMTTDCLGQPEQVTDSWQKIISLEEASHNSGDNSSTLVTSQINQDNESAAALLALLTRDSSVKSVLPVSAKVIVSEVSSAAVVSHDKDSAVQTAWLDSSSGKAPCLAGKSRAVGGGICSTLLAVIEQLRERSRSESEKEDNCLRSGRKRGGRGRSRQDSEEDSLETADSENVEVMSVEHNMAYRCKLCHYTSNRVPIIRLHMRTHRQKDPFECSLCPMVAESSEMLQEHMIKHCKVRTYACKFCPQSFNHKSTLRAHMLTHNESELFVCDVCDFETASPLLYRTHMQRHGGQTLIRCPCCPTMVSSRQSLRDHLLDSCSGRVSDLLQDRLEFAGETGEMYRCSQCDFTTKSLARMEEHVASHCTATVLVGLGGDTETSLHCALCDFTAVSSRSLKSHMKRHANDQRYVQQPLEQYKCSLCGYVCHHLPSLKSHMWRHASNENYSYQFTNDVINAAIDFDTRPTEPANWRTVASVNDVRETDDPDLLDRVLSAERRIVEGEVRRASGTGSRPVCWVTFRCCQCGFETINKAKLNLHMRTHADIIQRTLRVKPQLCPGTVTASAGDHLPGHDSIKVKIMYGPV